MIDPVIYDWPSSVQPSRQIFHAGGQSLEGGFTSGSVRVLNPEPGGVSWLEMEFGYQDNAPADALVSWLMSKVSNGNVFRVPIAPSPQVISLPALGITGLFEDFGLPWDNGQPWDVGRNWQVEPGAIATEAALDGTMSLKMNMGNLSNGLRPGHVIGHNSMAYMIDDIEYSGSIASITLMSPLRISVGVDDFINFRPKGLFTASNPDAFRGLYETADLVKLGSIRLMEAIP